MRVVVAGVTGLVGSRTVARLRDRGVDVVPVSRRTGVDVITGQGLAETLRSAEVVVDLTDAPSRAEKSSTEFFTTATANPRTGGLLPCEGGSGGVGTALTDPPLDRACRAVLRVRGHRVTLEQHADGAHVAPVLIRPVFRSLEIAGPEEYRLDDLTATLLAASGDQRDVISDVHSPFFSAVFEERTLLPATTAPRGHVTLAQWLLQD